MPGRTVGALVVGLVVLGMGCAAERKALAGPEGLPSPAGPPLLEATPGAEPAPFPGGVELRGELQAGTSGFGGTASVGWSNHRFGLGLTPGFSFVNVGTSSAGGSTTQDLGTFSLAAWGRLWFVERRVGELAGFGQLELGAQGLFGSLVSGNFGGQPGTTTPAPGLLAGAAGGAEYLVTPHLGLSVTLGVRLVTLNVAASPVLQFLVLTGLGFTLHQ